MIISAAAKMRGIAVNGFDEDDLRTLAGRGVSHVCLEIAKRSEMSVREDFWNPFKHHREEGDSLVIDTPIYAMSGKPVIDQILRGQRKCVQVDLGHSTHGHESIGLGASRQRAKPAIANREVRGKKMIDGCFIGTEVTHDQTSVDLARRNGGGKSAHEAVHRVDPVLDDPKIISDIGTLMRRIEVVWQFVWVVVWERWDGTCDGV